MFLFCRGSVIALEICGIPAISLELEAGCGDQLLVGILMAFRASGQHRVVKFLQMIFFKAAGVAAISIDRHGSLSVSKTRFSIIPERKRPIRERLA